MKKNRKLLLVLLVVVLAVLYFGRSAAAPAEPASTDVTLNLLPQETETVPESSGGNELSLLPELTEAIEEFVEPEPEPTVEPVPTAEPLPEPEWAPVILDEHGTYDSKEDVALYIYTYGHLPDNYITKKQAEAKGWTGGSLERYCPGMCIGGSYFGNYEGILPEAKGREYHECDIDTLGAKSRGAKRIVFSNDGLIYYTEDHYETFELLYGEE